MAPCHLLGSETELHDALAANYIPLTILDLVEHRLWENRPNDMRSYSAVLPCPVIVVLFRTRP